MDKISDWGRGNAPLQAQINTTPLPPEANILKKKKPNVQRATVWFLSRDDGSMLV